MTHDPKDEFAAALVKLCREHHAHWYETEDGSWYFAGRPDSDGKSWAVNWAELDRHVFELEKLTA